MTKVAAASLELGAYREISKFFFLPDGVFMDPKLVRKEKKDGPFTRARTKIAG